MNNNKIHSEESLFQFKNLEVAAREFMEPTHAVANITVCPGMDKLGEVMVDHLTMVLSKCDLTPSDVENAIEMLLALRVAQVNGKSIHGIKPKEVRYPALFDPFIRAIGKVEIPEEELVIDVDSPLINEVKESYKRVEILDLLDKLSMYTRQAGGQIATALPRSVDGDITVLSFQIINDNLMHTQRGHSPEKQIIASFVEVKMMEEIWSPRAYRVNYGMIESHHRAIRNQVEYSFARQ
jgi:hypothetical protein